MRARQIASKTPLACHVGALALLFISITTTVAAQESNALRLMQRMMKATEQLSYDGVFVYQRGVQVDAMRIVHKFAAGVERERLISLSGPKREVIRDGQQVTCLFADDREIFVEKGEPRNIVSLGLSDSVESLVPYYAFNIAGHDRVANRATTVVNIRPKERNRYGYQLWIDRESGLLLKSVIMNRVGHALEQVQFVQIAINAELPDSLFEPEIGGAGFTWHTNAGADNSATTVVETSGWSVNWLPAGFQMRNHQVQTMPDSDMPVSHMVYSDGLAMVSIFVEKLMEHAQPLQGFSSMGAVNTFSRVAGNFQITVVGEVPSATVRRIAGSVDYHP
ncbi:MAG: hypothetical protein E2O35_09790 [Proteobacteria bacterium]|nr:MAG: hypothetical protein E2O35_09790 [Pseudomonadota bacterium]